MSHGGIISQLRCCHNITMKILTSLITAIVTIFHPAGVDLNMLSATYRSSQYCLSDYRAQHRIDQLLPEYSRECDANPQFLGNIDDPELYTLAGERYLGGQESRLAQLGVPATYQVSIWPLLRSLWHSIAHPVCPGTLDSHSFVLSRTLSPASLSLTHPAYLTRSRPALS